MSATTAKSNSASEGEGGKGGNERARASARRKGRQTRRLPKTPARWFRKKQDNRH
jgi:hypothetical protein